jgi:hypothetical protein
VPEGPAGIWFALMLAIDIFSLVSVWRSRRHSRKAKGLWTGVVCTLPFLGAAAWLALGRERRRGRPRAWAFLSRWGRRPRP